MHRLRLIALILASVAAVAAQNRNPSASIPSDPAASLVRVRAFLTTTSPSVDLRLDGAEWANAVSPDDVNRVIIDGQTVHITRKTSGEADVQLDILLTSIRLGTSVTWTVTPVATGTSRLEIYNNNTLAPHLVERLDAGTQTATISTASDLLRAGGPLPPIPPTKHHLVLAFFYPWYSLDTWTADRRLYDSPTVPYSTDNQSDLQTLMTTAKNAGVDAFMMSWSGKDYNGSIDHQRMLRCLAAASASGFKVGVLFEMTLANPQHVDGAADADTVFQWLVDVVDDYASHPSYLRVDGRPVVLAYAAQRLTRAGWIDALSRLRATGRDVLFVGENSNNTRLAAFDGQFLYASNQFTPDSIETFDRAQSLNVRTYHLLPNDTIGRRVWVATVSPGYDDTHIDDGRVARVSPRDNGAYYASQWRAGLNNLADWFVITSWNEYFENTEIESSRLHGDLYLRLTKSWTRLYHALYPVAVPRQRM